MLLSLWSMKNFANIGIVFILMLCFNGAAGFAEDLKIKIVGDPFINHFSKTDYDGGTQNWAFVQGSNHILYVGNNNGILIFDGSTWDQIILPNQSVVRSLFQDKDGTIYAGGFNEFGYLKPNSTGKLDYFSLTSYTENTEFREFWSIGRSGKFLYFQTYDALVVWNTEQDEWSMIDADIQFGFLHELNDSLLLNETGKGLMMIDGLELKPMPGGEFFSHLEIWNLISLDGQMLACTQNDGIFEITGNQVLPWDTEIDRELIKNRLYSVEIAKDYLFWGSILNGLYITDKNGRILQNLNKTRGISNNTVLSLFLDCESNLWLGLDNGIDQIPIHSPASSLLSGVDIGSGYSSVYFEDRIFLGTNQGLYSIPDFRIFSGLIDESSIISINELAGQVWSLHVAGDYLLVGHNFGTFSVRGGNVKKISETRGGWNFEPVPGHPNLILQGTYDGLQLFEVGTGEPRLLWDIQGFNESARTILFEDEHNVWVGHGYQGIYRLTLNEEYSEVVAIRLFDESSNLGSKFFNELLSVDEEILVCNNQGFYIFNHELDDFETAKLWNKNFLEYGRMTRLIHESDELYWYFQEEQAGKLRIFNDTLFVKDTRILTAVDQSFNPSFENIFFLTDRDLIFGTNEGFVHLDPLQKLPEVPEYPVLFSLFSSLRSDDATKVFLEYYDDLGIKDPIHPLNEIPYRDNDIRISFVAPFLMASGRIEYQYLLEGLTVNWSTWTENGFAEFTNLREGDYLLKVRARNAFGMLSAEEHLYFRIKTPWYRSLLAYLSYFILLGLVISLSWYSISKRLEREKRRTSILEKRRMLHEQLQLKRDSELAEKEIVKLRNEKLKADIRNKSKQLANQTMDVLQKNRFLTDIKLEMIDLKKKAQSEEVRSSMRKMIRKIDRNIEDEHTHKIFETNFDQVHENFLARLQVAFPNLSAKDLRLCAYLRLNLSSKEIAPLLNISVRGVEISRYRLRKKLNLNHQQHLADFILGF